MPSFTLLSDDDIDAVVDYVLALTHRGELEVLLTLEPKRGRNCCRQGSGASK